MTSPFPAASFKASRLTKWGYEVVTVEDGSAAWNHLKSSDAPRLALLDWMMPGLDGVEVCRELRRLRPEPYTYRTALFCLRPRTQKRISWRALSPAPMIT